MKDIISVVAVEDEPRIKTEKIFDLPIIRLYVVGRRELVPYDGLKYAKKKATKMSRK